MRVLIVGINFSPELTGIGPHARAYADLLHSSGHDVTVVTGLPHYPAWRRGPRGTEAFPYKVVRCWHYVPRGGAGLGRAFYEATFAASVAWHLRRMPSPDLVLTVVPSLASALVSAIWSEARSIRVGVVVQDIVSEAASQTGGGSRVLSYLAGRMERALFRRAKAIGLVSQGMIATVRGRGARSEQIQLLPNWEFQAPVDPPSRTDARRMMGFGDREFVCLHAGNIGAKQGLDVVAQAARDGMGDMTLRFVLIGDGNYRSDLARKTQEMPNFQIWPLQTTERYAAALRGADVLLLTQRKEVTDMAFPSKLIPYAWSGTPIVAAVSGTSAVGQALARTGAALLVPPEQPGALVAAISRVRHESPLRERLSAAARSYFINELNAETLKARFLAFVRECAEPGQRP